MKKQVVISVGGGGGVSASQTSIGGQGIDDAGKLVLFDGNGNFSVSGSFFIHRIGASGYASLDISAITDERSFLFPDRTGQFALTDGIGSPVVLQLAASDETTDLTTGTAKVTLRMPFAMTLTDVRASVNTAPTGAAIIVDINENGASVLSTKLSIDATEKTSTTADTPALISDAALADDAEVTIDIDQIGSTVAGKGLKVTLIGTRA
jgi:hypothetical protein